MKNSCNKLSEFTTDGCSGGMSLLWNNLLGKLPFLPDRLPWEQDCINHDHAYHIGGSKADRLYADRRLAAAVTAKGYPIIAALMFYAVRIGGVKWLPTHWRWGYGWVEDDGRST